MPPADGRTFWRAAGQGLRLELLVQPGARRNEIEGLWESADGACVLKLRVSAAPEGGKANAAVIKLLSKALRLPKSAFEIDRGASARRKSLLIAGDPEDLSARFAGWLEAPGGGRLAAGS